MTDSRLGEDRFAAAVLDSSSYQLRMFAEHEARIVLRRKKYLPECATLELLLDALYPFCGPYRADRIGEVLAALGPRWDRHELRVCWDAALPRSRDAAMAVAHSLVGWAIADRPLRTPAYAAEEREWDRLVMALRVTPDDGELRPLPRSGRRVS